MRKAIFLMLLLLLFIVGQAFAETSSKQIVDSFVDAILNRDGKLAKTYLDPSLQERIPSPTIGDQSQLSDIEIENTGNDVFIVKGYIGPYLNQYPKHVVFIWELKVENSKIIDINILHDYTYGAWLKNSKSKVVVASVPSEKEYEAPVYLLAEKRSQMMDFENFTVQIGDKGQEIFNFPKWRHVKYDPGLYYKSSANSTISTRLSDTIAKVEIPISKPTSQEGEIRLNTPVRGSIFVGGIPSMINWM